MTGVKAGARKPGKLEKVARTVTPPWSSGEVVVTGELGLQRGGFSFSSTSDVGDAKIREPKA